MINKIEKLLEDEKFNELDKIDFTALSIEELEAIENKAEYLFVHYDPDENRFPQISTKAENWRFLKEMELRDEYEKTLNSKN